MNILCVFLDLHFFNIDYKAIIINYHVTNVPITARPPLEPYGYNYTYTFHNVCVKKCNVCDR